VQVLDRMQQRYPSGTPLWAAVAACLEAFQRHGALLDPFFGRVPAKAVDPPAEPPKPVARKPPPPRYRRPPRRLGGVAKAPAVPHRRMIPDPLPHPEPRP
jgi:hypothetical protein